MVQTAATDPRINAPATKGPRMMVFEVDLPDGSTAEIEAPEGTTQPQLMEALGLPSGGMASSTGGLVPDRPAQGRPSSAMEDLVRGGLRGLEDAAAGTAQFAARVGPMAGPMESMGATAALDDFVQGRQQEFNQTVAAESGAGRGGRILGGLAGTAPAGAAALPAKGAALIPALARAGAGGSLAAVTATPAQGDDYWTEKAPEAAVGGVLGAGILGGMRTAARTAEEVTNLPRRAVNFMQERANKGAIAAEGEALAQRTGIPLTPGMVSGGRAQTFAENMARQSIFTADRAMEADIRVAEKALEYVNNLGKKISPGAAGADTVGVQVQGAVRGAVERTVARRDEVARKQYGAIHEALGGRPIVDYSRTREVLEGIANGGGGSLSGDSLRAAQQAKKLLGQMADGKPRTLQQAIQDRSFWGRSTRGDGNVFNDVSSSANRRFASQLYGAIQDDIRAAADKLDGATTAGPGLVPYKPNAALPPGVGLGDALREADQNYRLYSEALGALEASPMARLLGDDIAVGDFLQFNKIAPETVVKKLGAMAPSELEMTRKFMQQNAPDTWAQYKRLLLDEATEAASLAPASGGVRQIPLNAGQFIRAIGGDKNDKIAKLRAVFEPQEMREIDDALQAMRRMGDKFGTNFSGTDPRAEARSLFEAVKSGSGTAVASTAGELSGLRAVSRLMLNSDGRRAVIELSKLPPNARRYPALLGYASAVLAGQEMAYPEEGGAGQQQAAPRQ